VKNVPDEQRGEDAVNVPWITGPEKSAVSVIATGVGGVAEATWANARRPMRTNNGAKRRMALLPARGPVSSAEVRESMATNEVREPGDCDT